MNHPSEPLVSVIMPTYNGEEVLRESVESVLAQTHRNLEVILVDDASPDGTSTVASSFTDPRVRFLSNPTNLGEFATRNSVMGLVKGDFVANYHHDDFYEPDIVARELAYLRVHPQAGAVFCMDHYMDEQGKIFGGTALPRQFQGKDSFTYDDIFPFLLRHQNILLRSPTVMARREVLAAVGPFNPDAYQSAACLELWIRIVRQYPIGILKDRLMRYRVGKRQWSSRYNHLRTERHTYFSVMDHYLEADGWCQRLSPDDLVEYAFHRCDDETVRAANLVIRGDTAAARELLTRPYPWRSLVTCFRRRKLRVLLLRALMRAHLAFGTVQPLSRLLIRTEYGGTV